jgi:hypothetical protein
MATSLGDARARGRRTCADRWPDDPRELAGAAALRTAGRAHDQKELELAAAVRLLDFSSAARATPVNVVVSHSLRLLLAANPAQERLEFRKLRDGHDNVVDPVDPASAAN